MKKRSTGVMSRIRGIFIFLIILAALGAVFYFGYYQFQLPADTYAVIFTKWKGWNPEVVIPASNRIELEGLIPANLKMEKFVLEPRIIELSLSGELPSANDYSFYLEGEPDFSYEYVFSISYTINPASLPSLAADDFLRSETLDQWYDELEKTLILDGISFINMKTTDDAYMSRISYNFRMMEADLISDLSARYGSINIISFSPVLVKIPDFDLYREGKRQYFSMARFNEKVNMETREKTTTRLIEESAKIELLNKYGELFTKYPELLNYYAIYKDEGKNLLPPIQLQDFTD